MTKATTAEVSAFFRAEFPHQNVVIEQVGNSGARLRRTVDASDLRPGNTVSGPFMMSVADSALYAAILGEIGLVAQAVTSSLNINFFRRPVPSIDVIGDCKLLKVGKTLIVGEVTIYSDGQTEPVAHAVGTYLIPRR